MQHFTNFTCLIKKRPAMTTRFSTILVLLAFVFNSCMKDKSFRTYTIYRPEYKVRQSVKEAARLQSPKALSELGSFALYNNTMFINERNKGIHVIDYTNPTNPVNRGFIPIPGNSGVSIKNDILYADCYCDLFVFRIGAGGSMEMQNSLPGVFLSRMGFENYDDAHVELTWIKKDTTVSADQYPGDERYDCVNCKTFVAQSAITPNSNIPGNGGTSVGSSMAVFTIVNDYLYTVDRTTLRAFSIKNELSPVLESNQQVAWNVETIFPFKDKLFIGSMTGMFIYGLENPGSPKYISQFNHVRVCDPVIADDKYAYVTLRSGSACGGFTNQLDILNIEDIQNPVRIATYPFSNPHGLSKDGNVLFICDGTAGLKVIDMSDMNNVKTVQTLNIGKAVDVVAYQQKAFVMLQDAIQIYRYDQQFTMTLLGSIAKN